jgi:chromosome segregation ATPase
MDAVQDLTTQVVAYSVTDAKIAEIAASCADLTTDTPKGYEEVRIAIGNIVSLRTAIERRRVELKADALAWGKRVDGEARRLTVALEAIENPLKDKKKAVDDEKARIKAEADAAKLRALEAEIAANREREEARLRGEREAEERRLAAERAEIEAERAKLAEERRQADERAAAERARVDAEQRAERERLAAEREKLDAERRAVEKARQDAERAEFERKAREKAEQDAREKAERDRIAAEEARVAEAERQAAAAARLEALRPDVEKVNDFAAAIRDLRGPTVTTTEAGAWLLKAEQMLENVAAYLETEAGAF